MDSIQKSQVITDGLRRGFQDDTSKMAQRRCSGYDIGLSGQLTINPDEAAVVRWIFERYLRGDSLGKIAATLESKDTLSPADKPKWNWEHSISCHPTKNIRDGCCSKKPSALAPLKSKMMASWIGTSTPTPMRPLFLMRCFRWCSRKNSAALKILKT